MNYTNYILNSQNTFEEEEVAYVSNALLKVILITENEANSLSQNKDILAFKYQCIQHIEKELTNYLFGKNSIERNEKTRLIEIIAKLNTQKVLLEIMLSDDPEQRFLDLQATSERFAKKMQSSVE